jgi:competence protein ComEA
MNFHDQKHSYKDWFAFNKREQRGMLMLSFIILVLMGYRMYINSREPASKTFDPDKSELIDWIASQDSSFQDVRRNTQNFPEKSTGFPACFPFNPNVCSANDWRQLGLSEKQSDVLVRYISRGGQFKSIEDLRKIYVLPEGFVDHIAPCIKLPAQNGNNFSEQSKYNNDWRESNKSYEAVPVDLNIADTVTLRRIPGIGTYFARKIFQYREKLGGYHDITQLLEVYRMTPSKLDSIRPYIELQEKALRKIDINQVGLDELSSHPYISKREAAGLIAYRDKHGPFRQAEDLLRCKALDEKTFNKLRIYLDVR